MKTKLSSLILLFLLSLTVSCSKSDGYDSSRALSVKINGVTKYFNNIVVTQEVYPDYVDYIVTAKQTDDQSKLLVINLEKGALGSDAIYYIQYYDGTEYFDAVPTNLTTNITENTDLKIIGTFSGTLDNGGSTVVQFTQGTININI